MEYTNILTVLIKYNVPQEDAETLARAIMDSPAKARIVAKAIAIDYQQMGLEETLEAIRQWGKA